MKPAAITAIPQRAHGERVADALRPRKRSGSRVVEDLLRENAELRRLVAELESYRNLAYRDPLTGLWNRRYFEERLSEEMSHARRDPSRCFSVMVMDLNDLKRINDELGHAAGDAAIKRVSTFLRTQLREHDICCRTGGDEFAVILLDAGTLECEQLLARLRNELEAHNAGEELALGIAFGTATYPEDGATARGLYLEADAAMYRDKRRQKGGRPSTYESLPALSNEDAQKADVTSEGRKAAHR